MKQSNESPSHPAWFFRFFAVFAFGAAVTLGVLYADFFTDLLAPSPETGSVAYRLLTGLILVPGGLVISIMVLRRTHHNVTGLLLFLYAANLMEGTLRVGSPLQAFPLLPIIFRLTDQGIWLLPLYFPDGNAYPIRFQHWIRLHSVLTIIFYTAVPLFYPTVAAIPGIRHTVDAANPLFIPVLLPVRNIFSFIQGWLWIASVVLIVPSILLRFRASILNC
jgi:hypothetical protein